MGMEITDISKIVSLLGLSNKPICIHSSLKSFGYVESGPNAIINGFLDQNCTVLVPTFSSIFSTIPSANQKLCRNGSGDYSWIKNKEDNNKIYSTNSIEVDSDMGMIPKSILMMDESKRGNHPLNSFTAIGPLSKILVSKQKPLNVYAPLKELVDLGGYIVLMGVGIEKLTMLHLAEQLSGRTLFRRWAKNLNGETIQVEAGGCSEGFSNFENFITPVVKKIYVGNSLWKVCEARNILEITTQAIKENPNITHCGNSGCERCNDAVKGGPILV